MIKITGLWNPNRNEAIKELDGTFHSQGRRLERWEEHNGAPFSWPIVKASWLAVRCFSKKVVFAGSFEVDSWWYG